MGACNGEFVCWVVVGCCLCFLFIVGLFCVCVGIILWCVR